MPADVTMEAFVALKANTDEAVRILGATILLLPTIDAAVA